MNWEKIENSKLGSFAVRVSIICVALVFCYHLTIGVTLTKVEKIMNTAQWFQAKVDDFSSLLVVKGFERIVDRTELSEQDGEKLAEDMRQILKNLSPVIDEIVTYEPKKNQQ